MGCGTSERWRRNSVQFGKGLESVQREREVASSFLGIWLGLEDTGFLHVDNQFTSFRHTALEAHMKDSRY